MEDNEEIIIDKVGRFGYEGAHCLYCFLGKALWKKMHVEKCHCGSESWTVAKIIRKATEEQGQLDPIVAATDTVSDNNNIKGKKDEEPYGLGVCENPMFPFIPIQNILIPLLHLVLGLGNDVMNFFRDFIEERIEPLLPEEEEARSMAIAAEIVYEDAKINCMNGIDEVKQLDDIRKQLVEKGKVNIFPIK